MRVLRCSECDSTDVTVMRTFKYEVLAKDFVLQDNLMNNSFYCHACASDGVQPLFKTADVLEPVK